MFVAFGKIDDFPALNLSIKSIFLKVRKHLPAFPVLKTVESNICFQSHLVRFFSVIPTENII